MDVKENIAPVKPPKPKRAAWLVAAASFVAVLVIGTTLLLTLPGGEDGAPATPTETTAPPTPTTAGPETTIATTTTAAVEATEAPSVDLDAAFAEVSTHVAGFVDAVNAGTVGASIASRYFPSEGQVGCGPLVDESTCDSPALWAAPFGHPFLDDWLDHLVTVETVYEMGECRAVDDHGTVACELKSTSPHEPFYPGHRLEEFSLRFDGDRIDFAALEEVDIFEWKFEESKFESWLRDNHPDIAALMYTVAGANGFSQPKITSGSEVYSENMIEYVPLWRAAIESP